MIWKVGPLRAAGDAITATDWPVLMAFAENQALDADDTETLAMMCRGYCAAMRDGESPLAIAPVDQGEAEG